MPDAGEKPSPLKRILDLLKRLLGNNPASPGDPYAYVPAPVRRVPRAAAAPPSPTSKMIYSAAFLPAADDNSGLPISPPAW
jgi:hypothetical protein